MITDQAGACMGSQAWSKCDITRFYAKYKFKVKSYTSMHQAITYRLMPNCKEGQIGVIYVGRYGKCSPQTQVIAFADLWLDLKYIPIM